MTFLKMAQTTNPQQFIALYADEAVPYGKIVDILDKGSRNNLKIVLATKPASQQYAAPEPETQPATSAPTGGNQQPQQ
jgi:biopolymer transport protein ExbD